MKIAHYIHFIQLQLNLYANMKVWPRCSEEHRPMCPGSGEWGRGRVGDVLVRMRLFRLLVLQLEHTGMKKHINICSPSFEAPLTPAGCWTPRSTVQTRKILRLLVWPPVPNLTFH